MPRLSEHLCGPDIWVKRDDLLGLAGGGNKTRKLEYLVADALQSGADTLITCGAVQSNHCRLTASAASREGLDCVLVLEERVPGTYDPQAGGNNFLYNLLGAQRRPVPGGTDLGATMQQVASELAGAGKQAYIIPGGGSNPLGAVGYASCASEIVADAHELDLQLNHIVCASGSGGTHSGLLTGFRGLQTGVPVTGISVRHPASKQRPHVRDLAAGCANLIGLNTEITDDDVQVEDQYVGPGYSLPTDEMIEAVELTARLEGILLDPVYTGKTMAGLIGMVREGRFDQADNVVFVHTGGAPSLFHYTGYFT